MREAIENVAGEYGSLVPSREEGLIIFWLNDKIRNREIDREFTHQDLQQVIREVSYSTSEQQPQTERVLKNLLKYFIERPPDKPYDKYIFSNYANRFLQLVNGKFDNEYRNFPLKESLKRYASFKASEIKDIDDFLSWHAQGFDTTARQTVNEHLEAFKDEVTASINKLNNILYSDSLSGLEMAKRFSEIFTGFGEKSNEIKDALLLGTHIQAEVKKVVDMYYKKIEKSKHPQTEEEKERYSMLLSDYEQSLKIQQSVSSSFLLIDMRLAQIREKIVFASSKLKELQENFRNQSQFKLNFKRMLQYILSNSMSIEGEIILPAGFPRKGLPFESFKYISAFKYDFAVAGTNDVYIPTLDEEYENSERAKIGLELKRQEVTAKWVKLLKIEMIENNGMNITEKFFSLLESEKDIEIPLNVSFELLQIARNIPGFKIKIQRELVSSPIYKDIVTWKTKVYKNNSKK